MRIAAMLFAFLIPGLLCGCDLDTLEGIQDAIKTPFALAAIPQRQKDVDLRNQPVVLAGVVLDDSGHEVPAVQLLLDYERLFVTTYGNNADFRQGALTVGGHFHGTVPGRLLGFRVSCDGYYPQYFYGENEKTVAFYSEAGHTIRDGATQPLDAVHIVLRKRGPVTVLADRTEVIWVDAAGAGLVAPAKPPKDWDSARWIPNVEHAPAGCLYIATRRTAGGIPTIKIPANDGDIMYQPDGLRLGVSGEGNGVILYTPRDKHAVWYEMRQAPVTGYQSEIALDANVLRQFEKTNAICFYIKCGNQYGRGTIDYWETIESGKDTYSRYGMRVVLLMQPDGSRNLENDYPGTGKPAGP